MLKLALCGNDCNTCLRYIATQSGDIEQLREVAAIWRRRGWRDHVVPPEEMVCYGCLSANWCRYSIRECALEKSVDNCGTCNDYPCDKVLEMFERAKSYAESMKEKCLKEEYEYLLQLAQSKKENLDRVHKEQVSH